MAKSSKNDFLQYKGKPVVRCGNIIYYGDPASEFIAMLQIVTEKTEDGVSLPDKIQINILSTDESLPLPKRMVKRTEKDGLYNALNIACIWLERQLSEEKQKKQ